eukprot:jgi/Hompol1/1647/HPOL_000821-RA
MLRRSALDPLDPNLPLTATGLCALHLAATKGFDAVIAELVALPTINVNVRDTELEVSHQSNAALLTSAAYKLVLPYAFPTNTCTSIGTRIPLTKRNRCTTIYNYPDATAKGSRQG